jgi:ribonucleoside-diphosphate reductase beta chain
MMDYNRKINDRRLINGKDDVVQLYPIKYKWAWEYYNAANANHWLPQEISMQKDIEQWRTPGVITDNEKEVIKTALGFFTTADSLVANNLVLAIYSRITAPECRMYLLRQAYEEAIHTHSYQHIVESLGLDESEIFEKYKTVEAIYNKDNFVTDVAKCGNIMEQLLSFYIVMEGIFFYSSFAAIMSFKRRNLLPGTVEQFQYIMRDESMHLNFGIDLINGIQKEQCSYPGSIYNLVVKAVEKESAYAKTMLGSGILGMSADSFEQYVQFIADRRLESLHLEPIYKVKNPFPWMSEVCDLTKQKNFFESRVTEYSQGVLEWE